jgi:lipoprotein-anchoring transpeptidase ErfK/SrfK
LKAKIKQYQKERLAEKRRMLQKRQSILINTEYADAMTTEETIAIELEEAAAQSVEEEIKDVLIADASETEQEAEEETGAVLRDDKEDIQSVVLEEAAGEDAEEEILLLQAAEEFAEEISDEILISVQEEQSLVIADSMQEENLETAAEEQKAESLVAADETQEEQDIVIADEVQTESPVIVDEVQEAESSAAADDMQAESLETATEEQEAESLVAADETQEEQDIVIADEVQTESPVIVDEVQEAESSAAADDMQAESLETAAEEQEAESLVAADEAQKEQEVQTAQETQEVPDEQDLVAVDETQEAESPVIVDEVQEAQMEEEPDLPLETDAKEDVDASVEEDSEAERLDAAQKRKKRLKYTLVSLFGLLVLYGALALFFQTHFYFGTKINGVNVSGKSAQGAMEAIGAKAEKYNLELRERGGNTESIQGKEIDLHYEAIEPLEKLIAQQTYYNWVVESINGERNKTVPMIFDDEKLQERIDRLACFLPENTVKPTNPSFQYQDGAFVIIAGDRGKEVNKEALHDAVFEAVCVMEPQLDMDEKGCYVKPAYNLASPETEGVRNALNRCLLSQITYYIGEQSFVLDSSRTSQWLSVDENYQIVVDRASVDEYVLEMMNHYRALKRTTSFTTTGGSRIVVNGGDYRGVINREAEADFLIAAILKGEATERDLNNIGNTYVEISLSGQRLWFYKDGQLVVESAIVSGNVRRGFATPKGVYSLKYKQRNVVLKGADYESPVSFWMPFNGVVGMHDATWRSRFGGTIYINDGSHSCINLPYGVARTIYYNIVPGTPIVCY